MRIRRSLHVVNQDDGEDRRKTEHSIVSKIKVSVLLKDQKKNKEIRNEFLAWLLFLVAVIL